MTTRDEISRWFDQGANKNATHMIVACDTFDHDDYPVYCASAKEAFEKFKSLDGVNMQKVMEIYDLKADKDEQLQEHRAFRLPLVRDENGMFVLDESAEQEAETGGTSPAP